MTWLVTSGELDTMVPPGERITRDRVVKYVEHLTNIGNSSQTILSRLQELGDMARALAPQMSWVSAPDENSPKVPIENSPVVLT